MRDKNPKVICLRGEKYNGPPRTLPWYVYTRMLFYANVRHVLTFISTEVNWKQNEMFRPQTPEQ